MFFYSQNAFPAWIYQLASQFVDNVLPHEPIGTFSMGYVPIDATGNKTGSHLLALFPPLNETRGGELDGDVYIPVYSFSIKTAMNLFSEVYSVVWSPSEYFRKFDENYPCLTFKGIYNDFPVEVVLFHGIREGESPTLRVSDDKNHWLFIPPEDLKHAGLHENL